ncbi:RNA polymerase sigma factor [Prosthecobacter sp.]|jgi:RNA polymerase sigma factor (sigma-70 family)|uniref:RNA polymerase sigma factor n=1 Tax=Prosthecobacter sp. TaxID=1965333 RepID=UPI0037842375
MPPKLPDTPQSLLSELRNPNRGSNWQLSWERFLEIYYPALRTMCSNSYRLHSGGEEPPGEVIEDAVAAVIADFCTKSQYSYDPSKGKLRGFLKTICNARIVDHLRKEKRMLLHADMADLAERHLKETTCDGYEDENESYHIALLHSLLEDVRTRVSPRQFAIFELVKLKNIPVEQAAAELGVRRGVVDNTVYRVMNILRELASRPEYKSEWTT